MKFLSWWQDEQYRRENEDESSVIYLPLAPPTSDSRAIVIRLKHLNYNVIAEETSEKDIGIYKRLMKISSQALISVNTTKRTVCIQEIFDLN